MKIAPVADVKAHFSAYLDEAHDQGPVVITRNGKAVAVLLAPIDDDDLENLLISRSTAFANLIEGSRKAATAGESLTRDEFWKKAAARRRRSPVRR